AIRSVCCPASCLPPRRLRCGGAHIRRGPARRSPPRCPRRVTLAGTWNLLLLVSSGHEMACAYSGFGVLLEHTGFTQFEQWTEHDEGGDHKQHRADRAGDEDRWIAL